MSAELLQALGGKSDVLISLDFETYWDADYTLKKLTTEAYVRDPRFEVTGVGVKFGRRPTIWLEEWEFREWAARVDWSRVSLAAHHAHFDGLVLSHHYGIRPRFILCTLSMARALHGPARGNSLQDLALKYEIGAKGKEIDNTKGKRRADFTDAEWLAFGDYCKNDVDLLDRLLSIMADGFPLLELWLIDTTVRMFTEPELLANNGVLQRALTEERTKKAAMLRRIAGAAGVRLPEHVDEAQALEATRKILGSNDKFAAVLKSFGEVPPTKPNKKGTAEIYAFAKTDPGMQTLLEHPNDEIRFLAEARLSVKSNLVGTRTERLIGIAARGPVPFYLKYCGAHTHRWSGGDKMNPQNFNRGGALRDAIEAPEGSVLVVGDSGQIEARKVAWLAGQKNLLETFRRNDEQTRVWKETGVGEEGDFYSDAGSDFFKGKKLSKKETPKERQIAKALILGLGFNMGTFKCAGELLKGMLGTPPVQFGPKDAAEHGVDVRGFEARPYGRDVTCSDKVQEMIDFGARLSYADLVVHCAVADHFVRLYRRNNARIAGTWQAMNDLLGAMVSGEPVNFGPIRTIRHGIIKPSGLVLHYPGLRRSADGFVYTGGKSGKDWVKAYGGLITENVVQSLARDVVAEQALWMRAAGYRVKTTTHDEIVCVVPEAQGEECLRYMLERMRIPPAWCADLPLNASGAIAKSYGDAK